jgi:hypothetical protein
MLFCGVVLSYQVFSTTLPLAIGKPLRDKELGSAVGGVAPVKLHMRTPISERDETPVSLDD